MNSLKEQLETEVQESYAQIISEDKDQIYLAVICHRSKSGDLLNILKNYGFNKVVFSEMTGTIEQNIQKSRAEILKIEKRTNFLIKSIEDLCNNREDIEILYDYLVVEKDRKALGRLLRTESTFILEGWVPETEIVTFKKVLANGIGIAIHIKPEEGKNILFSENNKLVQPFEVITEMYSLPPQETDPMQLWLRFHILGLMLSDGIWFIIVNTFWHSNL